MTDRVTERVTGRAVDGVTGTDAKYWIPRERPADTPTTPVPRIRGSEIPADVHSGSGSGGPQVGSTFPDGSVEVTFCHRDAGADAVALAAHAWWNPERPEDCELDRHDGSDLWTATFRVPSDWEVSYRFVAHTGGTAPFWRRPGGLKHASAVGVPDQSNPLTMRGQDDQLSSVLRLPASGPRPWLRAFGSEKVGRTGRPTRWDVPDTQSGRTRTTWWWRPSDCSAELPLLVLFDGRMHARRLATAQVIADAIAAGVLPPTAVLMIDSGTPEQRAQDLGVPGGIVRFLGEDLLAALRRRPPGGLRPIATARDRVVVGGSSFGGLSALFAVARYPDLVGAAIAHSVSHWRYPPDALQQVLQQAVARVPSPVSLRLGAGRFEGARMVAENERLADQLAGAGVDVGYRAASGGHDWVWWIPHLVEAAGDLL